MKATPEMKIIDAAYIDGAAHLIPDYEESRNAQSWVVNTHVDLTTWNNVYFYEDDHI